MRSSAVAQFLYSPEGVLLGLERGDHCHAPDWNSSWLIRAFGVGQAISQADLDRSEAVLGRKAGWPFGLESRRNTKVPKSLRLAYYGPIGLEILHCSYWTEQFDDWHRLTRFLSLPISPRRSKFGLDLEACRATGLYFQMEDDAFAIAAFNPEARKSLGELNEAFQRCDISMALGPALSRQAFAIASRVSLSDQERLVAGDVDREQLLRAVEDIGIEQTLRAAGKSWYALSPTWTDDSRTSVEFFLNPAEQHRYNHGWFTPEQLGQWAREEGPVVKGWTPDVALGGTSL